ncbi:hypothetical protein B0H34DRAFT_789025 [Crassisporium funariophilum]|nr:hypothetical protein B0H34DRAFT_789025 [Crassisporium funariophilum]
MPPINLKQRLAALSLAQSSPSSPINYNGPDSPGLRSPTSAGKRKMFFNPPWIKRQQQTMESNGVHYAESESVMVQEVMSRMIFQAGVDFETRPMVVINASALPDPQVVSYDLLLSRILSYLNLYVEADYTVIFFAAGGKHAPSWNWVWKAYRSLSRKYRKNLKQLYIVHSSFFSKMLFSLAGAIISPKFFRKLMYISTLSELAHHVPLTQIDIPPAVYQENLKYERKISLPVPMRSSTFGVPLEDLMGYNGEKGSLPRVVRDSIQFLRDSGLTEEGLFRRSPSSVLLRAAQDAYDRGNVVSLETFGDPHLAAVLLKKYLRDLPEPIFPESFYPIIRRCPMPTNEPSDMSCINYIRDTLLPELVPCAYILLSQVLHLLHDVSMRSGSNKMDAFNLAVVICPNLVKGANPMRDVMMCSVPGSPALFEGHVPPNHQSHTNGNGNSDAAAVEGRTTLGAVILCCIRRYYEVFDEVVDRSEPIAPWRALRSVGQNNGSSSSSSNSGSPRQPMYVLSNEGEEEDLDDDDAEMLVMPIGPDAPFQRGAGPPSAWGNGGNGSNGAAAAAAAGARSMHTVVGNGSTRTGYSPYPTYSKAKSMISVENGGGTRRGSGSITIGRGTTRKGSGAAVEAVGVTAEGFFTALGNAPPVPTAPSVKSMRRRWEGGE